MIIKYYLTHFNQLPVAIITIAVIIFSVELLLSKKFYPILSSVLILAAIYCFMYQIDKIFYYQFRKQILSDN